MSGEGTSAQSELSSVVIPDETEIFHEVSHGIQAQDAQCGAAVSHTQEKENPVEGNQASEPSRDSASKSVVNVDNEECRHALMSAKEFRRHVGGKRGVVTRAINLCRGKLQSFQQTGLGSAQVTEVVDALNMVDVSVAAYIKTLKESLGEDYPAPYRDIVQKMMQDGKGLKQECQRALIAAVEDSDSEPEIGNVDGGKVPSVASTTDLGVHSLEVTASAGVSITEKDQRIAELERQLARERGERRVLASDSTVFIPGQGLTGRSGEERDVHANSLQDLCNKSQRPQVGHSRCDSNINSSGANLYTSNVVHDVELSGDGGDLLVSKSSGIQSFFANSRSTDGMVCRLQTPKGKDRCENDRSLLLEGIRDPSHSISHHAISGPYCLPCVTSPNHYQRGSKGSNLGCTSFNGLGSGAGDARNNEPYPEYPVGRLEQSDNARSPHSAGSLSASVVSELTQALHAMAPVSPIVPKFSGVAGDYFRFRSQVMACIVEPLRGDARGRARALQLIIESTCGQPYELIKCCHFSPNGLMDALELLETNYGSVDIEFAAHLQRITSGPKIAPTREGMTAYYIALQSCKIAAQNDASVAELNSTATVDSIFRRLPLQMQREASRRAQQHAYGDQIPFDFLLNYVKGTHNEASTRWGRIIATESSRDDSHGGRGKTKYSKVSSIQSDLNSVTEMVDSSRYLQSSSIKNAKDPSGCGYCYAIDHTTCTCDKFAKLGIDERRRIVKDKFLCYKCLKRGHTARNCQMSIRCGKCGYAHNDLIHVDRNSQLTALQDEVTADDIQDTTAAMCIGLASPKMIPKEIYDCSLNAEAAKRNKLKRNKRLMILPVAVSDYESVNSVETLAFIDNGADTHVMQRSLFERLKLAGDVVLSVTQYADRSSTGVVERFSVACRVKGTSEAETYVLRDVLVQDHLPILTSRAPQADDIRSFPHLKGVEIPNNGAEEVELLIGGHEPYFFLPLETRSGGPHSLWAIRTVLGWTLCGQVDTKVSATLLRSDACVNLILNEQLSKATNAICPCGSEWDDINCDPELLLPSIEDEIATEIMQRSCTLVENHLQLDIPFRPLGPNLPPNEKMATSRLLQLKRKLQREPETHTCYREKIDGMINEGHAILVNSDAMLEADGKVWFIPHHCITNPKFRVVFDCRSECEGVSLNSQVLQGPDNTNTLLGVLLRFRFHKIAVVGDIKNMFHQVKVSPECQSVLRFLWWEGGDYTKPVKKYQLTVHPFGLRSSPSVASFALRKVAQMNLTGASEDVIKATHEAFYVDDMLVSVPSVEACTHLLRDLNPLLLQGGGFTMAKYVSNSPEVLSELSPEQLAPELQEIALNDSTLPPYKVLGLSWDPNSDTFGLQVQVPVSQWTRRMMLSIMAGIYDPLGEAAPFLLPAKIMMRQLIQKGIGWDTEMCDEDRIMWSKWLNSLDCLSELRIPRVYDGFTNAVTLELHLFADASQLGFGAVCYLVASDGICRKGSFVMGKSKVAPIPSQTIPRLELCGARLAVKLGQLVIQEHGINFDRVVYWSDSTTVLSYISSTTKHFDVFEHNRVKYIRQHTTVEQWHWVCTKENPADWFSRGVMPSRVDRAVKWLKVPQFLCRDELHWPKRPSSKQNIPGMVMRNGAHDPVDAVSNTATCIVDTHLQQQSGKKEGAPLPQPECVSGKMTSLERLTSRYSCLDKTVRCAGWLLRVKNWLRSRVNARNDHANVVPCLELSPVMGTEYECALHAVVRLAQQQAYPGLVEALENMPAHKVYSGKRSLLPSSSLPPLAKYAPFVGDGVIRIGGRLDQSSESHDFCHPIVLPKRHHITGLIIDDAHRRNGHFGTQQVGNVLRERFHVISFHETIKHYIESRCMACRNRKASPGQQRMASLPLVRVTPSHFAFEISSIDFMGPIAVRVRRSNEKHYCCIFSCMSSRATHLELACSLTTSSFLMALRRFQATRGHATRVIYSDNATNFVGAENELARELSRIDHKRVARELSQIARPAHAIKWCHSPPLASHQGGTHESIIRLVRKTMTALTDDRLWRTLDAEKFMTLLKEIEYILNCRPLTRSSADPENLSAISPMALLTLGLDAAVDPSVPAEADALRASHRSVQYWADQFWRRWRAEYLPLLQRRTKWLEPHKNFQVGDLVLMIGDDTPRNAWPRAIVTEVMPHSDGAVRRVRVRTANKQLYMRDIRKLVRLEGDI